MARRYSLPWSPGNHVVNGARYREVGFNRGYQKPGEGDLPPAPAGNYSSVRDKTDKS